MGRHLLSAIVSIAVLIAGCNEQKATGNTAQSNGPADLWSGPQYLPTSDGNLSNLYNVAFSQNTPFLFQIYHRASTSSGLEFESSGPFESVTLPPSNLTSIRLQKCDGSTCIEVAAIAPNQPYFFAGNVTRFKVLYSSSVDVSQAQMIIGRLSFSSATPAASSPGYTLKITNIP